jgi:uncharacterized membrane protein (DUF106 family)
MMTAVNQDGAEAFVTITQNQYLRFQRDQEKLEKIKSHWDEYQMRRKLLGERITEGNMHRLRRRTLNKMGQLLQGNFNA